MKPESILSDVVSEAKKQGLTQAQLAQAAGIHPVSLSKALSTGRYEMDTLQRLCRVLGLRILITKDNDIAAGLQRGDLF